jgi:hypothetical protein
MNSSTSSSVPFLRCRLSGDVDNTCNRDAKVYPMFMYVLPLARILTQELNLFDIDVYNKVDAISLEQMDKLAREEHTVVISCEMDLK